MAGLAENLGSAYMGLVRDALPGGDPGKTASAAWVGAALEAALRARAPGVHASTPMVRQLAIRVGRELGQDTEAEALLDLSVRVRDIGMLALPDSVVLATAPLSPTDWELVNRHPAIGAQLLDGLSVVAGAAQIVRAHHERWDGEGYPDGRRGDAIPPLSRLIATCDAFVAMASDRPYRRGIGAEAALEHVTRERGSQFDPIMVDALISALAATRPGRPATPAKPAPAMAQADGQGDKRARVGRGDLTTAIAEFDVVPAFAPACERVLDATTNSGTTAGEIVTAVENDTGLTIAVLRRAQTVQSRHPIANVVDAVAALSPSEIQETVKALPRTEFPWRTSQLDVLMNHSRAHAQAVTRAADRIGREARLVERDDLLVVALLHDVGKLVLGRARADYTTAIDVRSATPEARIRQEQRAMGMDHASLGGLLLRRWGLPASLAKSVAAHHSSEAENAVATHVRLADMIAHHAQGETVDRNKMLALARLCGQSPNTLRNVLFDLPHSGGSQRRRAEPSPLSSRETIVLGVLAQGKVYKEIALELGLATSTVRSHLHNAYTKLGVDDRAQAVLRATEMGWI